MDSVINSAGLFVGSDELLQSYLLFFFSRVCWSLSQQSVGGEQADAVVRSPSNRGPRTLVVSAAPQSCSTSLMEVVLQTKPAMTCSGLLASQLAADDITTTQQ